MPWLCRHCAPEPCGCARPHRLEHPELFALSVAHVDADAFFAAVEKRRRPELAGRPVIVGGGTRGVVSTACYIARLSGVGSAMPMFKALKLCPDAVVLRPDFAAYSAVAAEMRRLMLALTPAVQPLSIDEAALDLAGTEAVHGAPPAAVLAGFARQVEASLGVTVSIGLARNRMLAKIAASLDKPRGFAVLGSEAASLLAPHPVTLLPGVGPAQARRLAALGITRIGQLQGLRPAEARRRLGEDGPALVARAEGEDARRVDPRREAKSVSAETTFAQDLSDPTALEAQLWPLAEKLARRLRETELAASGVVLKLKTARFALRTRQARLAQPTVLPDLLFAAGAALLAREADGTAFRLIGLGAAGLAPLAQADQPSLADPDLPRLVARQKAIDGLRERFGVGAIKKGRMFFF